jgi:hypothetical protein
MLSKIAVPSVGRVAQARVKIDSAPIPAAKAVHLLPQTTLVDAALTSDRTSDLTWISGQVVGLRLGSGFSVGGR